MYLEQHHAGYWKDKLYFICNYQNKNICYILINGYEEGSWVIGSDDSDSNWFEDFPLNEHIKEILWKNVNICDNPSACGACSLGHGTRKTIFGKEFHSVCLSAFKFTNPDAETVECIKQLFEIRKNDINTSEELYVH